MEEELSSIAIAMVEKNIIDLDLAKYYYQEAVKQKLSFFDYLIKFSIFKSLQLALFLSNYFNLQFVDLDDYEPSPNITKLIPDGLINNFKIMPLYVDKLELIVAIDDPTNQIIARDLRFYTQFNLIFVVVESDKLTKKLQNVLYKKQVSEPEVLYNRQNSQNTNMEFEDQAVKTVNNILNNAFNQCASDVHIEPISNYYRIRFRIDGLLLNISQIDYSLASRVCSRIKILANLNIVEHRLPQDGRFSFHLDSMNIIDCRVSICPTTDGEKIVIRFLNKGTNSSLHIDNLHLEDLDKKAFLKALACTHGLILVTGPTGSGKSTTLYTALNYLISDKVNIISVEDPVEMNIPGVNQIQVSTNTGLDFATILRAILRQDPDIIMIGEIRDLETAQIAVQASETGHLVLASLHTNSAAQTISRLINLGIPTYNLFSVLRLVVAQRLVRKLCVYCYNKNSFDSDSKCLNCTNGYNGRIGIFEIMSISNSLAYKLYDSNLNLQEISELACNEGMQLLKNAGLNLVERGITSLEELKRVVEI